MLANAAALIICGLLAGLVVAAAAFPAAALTGLAAKAGAETFDGLPSELEVPHAPQITNVYASDGKTLITSLYDENRRDVPIDQIAPVMQEAVVASEDQRFFDHNGVDPKGVLRAFVADQKGEAQQGASTLTMQYVRLAISYSADTPQEVVDATEDTPTRKLREMHLAIELEKKVTEEHGGDKHAAKLDILDRYLNIAPFGHGAFGIYAASQVYFSTAPSKLTLDQAALLAGLLQATSSYDPTTPDGKKAAQARRNNHVLPGMRKLGYINDAQLAAAQAQPVVTKEGPTHNGCTSTVNARWGFFCDYLYRWWLQQPAFGADTYSRENQLLTGGYKIVTSLNVKTQRAADAALKRGDHIGNPTAMMLAAVEPGKGYVEAVAVNRNYSNDNSGNPLSTNPAKHKAGIKANYPNTTVPLVTGDGSPTFGYQFGSTFKMFTMLGGLYAGLPLNYTINAPNKYQSNFPMGTEVSKVNCDGYYCPTNASKGDVGKWTIWEGYGKSVNTFFVPLEDRVGLTGANGPITIAKRLGLNIPATDDVPTFGSFTLGVTNSTPLQMASAYATMAADGVYCTPSPVKSITDFNGNSLAVAQPQCKQAIDPDIAHAALDAARCPVGDQSAFGECHGSTAPYGRHEVGRPVAGKTGTTDSNQAQALITMTPQLAVAGVVTDPDNPLHSLSIPRNKVNYAVLDTLRDAMKGLPVENFPAPPRSLAYGTPAHVPGVTCASVSSATARLKAAGFRVIVQQAPGSRVGSGCSAGAVAKTDPSGESVEGAIIALYLSSGHSAPPPNKNPGGPTPPGDGPQPPIDGGGGGHG
jgi:membrane peptidoglycan carboxypeptidase